MTKPLVSRQPKEQEKPATFLLADSGLPVWVTRDPSGLEFNLNTMLVATLLGNYNRRPIPNEVTFIGDPFSSLRGFGGLIVEGDELGIINHLRYGRGFYSLADFQKIIEQLSYCLGASDYPIFINLNQELINNLHLVLLRMVEFELECRAEVPIITVAHGNTVFPGDRLIAEFEVAGVVITINEKLVNYNE